MELKKTVTIVGLGYVGMSLAVLLAKKEKVLAYDIDKERLQRVKNKISTVEDSDISRVLLKDDLDLSTESSKVKALSSSDYIVVCVPTSFNARKGAFETEIVENVIRESLKLNENSLIVVKSTVPIGFIDKMAKEYSTDRIVFSPEFLREGRALYDNMYPTRIVMGSKSKKAKGFVDLLLKASRIPDVPVFFCGPREAESIKLFSNAYLAMRVSFFN